MQHEDPVAAAGPAATDAMTAQADRLAEVERNVRAALEEVGKGLELTSEAAAALIPVLRDMVLAQDPAGRVARINEALRDRWRQRILQMSIEGEIPVYSGISGALLNGQPVALKRVKGHPGAARVVR